MDGCQRTQLEHTCWDGKWQIATRIVPMLCVGTMRERKMEKYFVVVLEMLRKHLLSIGMECLRLDRHLTPLDNNLNE